MKSIIKIWSMDCDGFCPWSASVYSDLNSLCQEMVTPYLSGNSAKFLYYKKGYIWLSSAAPAVSLFPFMSWIRGKKWQGEVDFSAKRTADRRAMWGQYGAHVRHT